MDPVDWPKLPVVEITVSEAQAFADWLTKQSGGRHHFRLPTLDEWEVAARGMDEREFPWGNCFSYEDVWANWMPNMSEDPFEERAPVGSFPDRMSPYGILDMAGNVSEFTSGCPRSSSPGTAEPSGTREDGLPCSMVVLRGGNLSHLWYDATVVRASQVPLDSCSAFIGFRVAMDVDRDE